MKQFFDTGSQLFFRVTLFLLFGSVLALTGCGGGGGGTTASVNNPSVQSGLPGQVAIGAPMSYATISVSSLVDNTRASYTADINGQFSVSDSITYPALVKATSIDANYIYFGYITSSSQAKIAINPLSTLVLALAKGGSPSNINSPLTPNSITTAQAAVFNIFSQIFNLASVTSNTDLLSTTFSTNHTGLDLVLDAIFYSFNIDGSITLTNKITQETTKFTPLTALTAAPINFSSTAFNKLNTIPLSTCSNFLNSITSDALSTDGTLYDGSYLNNGLTSAQNMAKVASSTSAAGFKFAMPIFSKIDQNGNFVFRVLKVNPTTKAFSSNNTVTVKSNNNSCVLVGNQFPIFISIAPSIVYDAKVDGNTQFTTPTPLYGYSILLGQATNNNTYNGQAVASATVDYCTSSTNCINLTTLTASNYGNWIFNNCSFNGSPEPCAYNLIPNPAQPFTSNLDSPIKITFFDSSNNQVGNPLYTYIEGDAYSSAEISAIQMPSISNPNLLQNSSQNPTFNYTSGNILVNSITLSNLDSTTNLTNLNNLILSSNNGSTTFNGFNLSASASDRRIILYAGIPNRPSGSIKLTYIWNPNGPFAR